MNERNAELKAITTTLDLYVEGLHKGDIEALKKAFHPKAMMYGISGGVNITITEIEGLYAFVSANNPPWKSGEPHQCFVTNIHYEGNAASAEMVEEAAFDNDYTNYFQLLKIEGRWQIVSKTFNGVARKS
jgi:hypothetical protein